MELLLLCLLYLLKSIEIWIFLTLVRAHHIWIWAAPGHIHIPVYDIVLGYHFLLHLFLVFISINQIWMFIKQRSQIFFVISMPIFFLV